MAEDGDTVMSEDCLTVNVWTPAVDAGHRPVMVFIHGGAFEEGSAANSWYDGAFLAERGDVVVVSLQYRLGVFGFLELGELGGSAYASSGNNGILDQIAALKWVQQNAAAFGGDPGNVTLFGESAGGASIHGLLASPLAKSLFHKAIIESGDPAQFQTLTQARQSSREFQNLAHAHTVAELQRLSPEALLRAQLKLFDKGYDSTGFVMVDDDIVFRGTPIDAFSRNPEAGVPLLIGTNAEESRYTIAMDAIPIDKLPEEVLRKRLAAQFGAPGSQLLDVYKKYGQSYEEAVATLLADSIFRIPSIRLAEINSARQPTYMYLFTYRSPTRGPTGLKFGAMHGLEVAFVFHVDTPLGYIYVGPKGSWRVLSEQMVAAWTHFAHTGDPNNDLLPTWPKYDGDARATMALGLHSDVMLDPYGLERRAWDGIPSNSLENTAVMRLGALPNE